MSYKLATSMNFTTEDAIKSFRPGQKISLKPLGNRPIVTFTICKLFTPVTKCVALVAASDPNAEKVVLKIYDPRYLDERVSKSSRPSYPWNIASEREAAATRLQDTELSDDELRKMIYETDPRNIERADDRIAHKHNVFKEERFYRSLNRAYDNEVSAYEHLKDFQGSAIPRFIMAGEIIPPDHERAIHPRTIVLEYIPSVSLLNISPAAITPALCDQAVSATKRLASCGVLQYDLSVTNILFTPAESPERVVIIDFGHAWIWDESDDESDKEDWTQNSKYEEDWTRKLLESMAMGDRKWVPQHLRTPSCVLGDVSNRASVV